jgi:DNA-binding CsgD family transcriptional regulator
MASQRIQELVSELTTVNTIKDIHRVCETACDYFGFDSFHYGAQLPSSFTKPVFIDVSGYPASWWERYKEAEHIRHDPVIKYCIDNNLPVSWDELKIKKNTDAMGWKIMGEAFDHGVKGGVSFPLHTAQGEDAMLSFASERGEQYVRTRAWEMMPEGSFFTAYLHESVRAILGDSCFVDANVRLTDRERECLLWTADGKTTWETAQILKISERTVIFHVQNVTEKLKVNNRQQAVARAIVYGLIRPQYL